MKIAVPVLYSLTALIMGLTGLLLLKYPSKYPDTRVGYRVKASVHSKENWEKGNKLAGRLCMAAAMALMFAMILQYLFSVQLHIMLAAYFILALISIAAVVFAPIILLTPKIR